MSVGGYQFINGADSNNNALTVSKTGANIQLNNGKVTNLAAGTANTDSVNFGQLKNTAQSTAKAIGGGSALNSDGTISAPSFALTNANSINGTSGAATDVGTAFGTVDAALGKLNSNVTQNTADIASLKTNVAQNSSDIAQNTSDISNINQQIASGNVGLVRQDATTQNITVAKDTGGTVVDMTGTDGTRTVTGVSAGALSADSTDAVNGSQLYQTNQNVSSLAQQLSNVEGAASTVASQKTDTPAVASGTDSTALGNGSKATGNNSVALGSGSVADEDNTVSIGSKGNERRLTNVAPGINGTDGVNMNQLNAVQSNVDTVARQAFSGIAAAMAMPNLTPSQPGKTVVAAGVANYKGYTAMGVGGTYRSRDSRWLVNAAASITPHGDAGVRGQVGYEF
ncbi:YadA-like family protein [Caballeronia sp. LZ002]|nr:MULTISPECIES: YadA-like family protein [unclassified Caballeronia]MDR5770640.1 YadA-like family protein [Caballeronia sp. LZ002]MDR5846077.1 YadA-like family protein [Caballeronia sp. LZ003]